MKESSQKSYNEWIISYSFPKVLSTANDTLKNRAKIITLKTVSHRPDKVLCQIKKKIPNIFLKILQILFSQVNTT